MAFKCGTYKAVKNECISKNNQFEKLKYQNYKYSNIRSKDIAPLGGTYFVDILRKKDEKRAAKNNYNSNNFGTTNSCIFSAGYNKILKY